MKKGFYSLLFFAIISAVSAQEKIKYFDLSYTDKKIENSLYSNIKFLDSREDTSGMGIVRVGNLNKEAVVRSNGSFQGQLRNVTFDDYVIRSLSLPAEYGTVAKVYASKPDANSRSISTIDLYVLSYNNTKQLTNASNGLKRNLNRKFLSVKKGTEQ